jgi:hypothetical protein
MWANGMVPHGRALGYHVAPLRWLVAYGKILYDSMGVELVTSSPCGLDLARSGYQPARIVS